MFLLPSACWRFFGNHRTDPKGLTWNPKEVVFHQAPSIRLEVLPRVKLPTCRLTPSASSSVTFMKSPPAPQTCPDELTACKNSSVLRENHFKLHHSYAPDWEPWLEWIHLPSVSDTGIVPPAAGSRGKTPWQSHKVNLAHDLTSAKTTLKYNLKYSTCLKSSVPAHLRVCVH